MVLPNFLSNFLRLDNNNGIHFLGEEKLTIKFLVQQAKKNANKKYWIIENGLKIKAEHGIVRSKSCLSNLLETLDFITSS